MVTSQTSSKDIVMFITEAIVVLMRWDSYLQQLLEDKDSEIQKRLNNFSQAFVLFDDKATKTMVLKTTPVWCNSPNYQGAYHKDLLSGVSLVPAKLLYKMYICILAGSLFYIA